MPAKFNILVAASIPLVPLIPLLACGGDSKTPDANIHVIDGSGGSGSGSGSGSGACTAAASYAVTFGSNSEAAQNTPATGSGSAATPHEELWLGLLNNDKDELFIQLYAGYGGFGSGDIRPGTYNLAMNGDDKFSTCGACVLAITDIMGTGSASTFKDYYTAKSGTLTLTSTTGTIAGSMSNIVLQHVTQDAMQNPSDTVADSCTSTIGSAAFSAPLQMGSAAFEGKLENGRLILHGRFN